MTRIRALAACSLTLVVSATLTSEASAQSCPSPSTHEVTDLGTLGGNDSFALDINAAGQIVGGARAADGSLHPFLHETGPMASLGTLGGTFGIAGGINASGQVAGQSFDSFGQRRAFLWEGGFMQDLGTLGGSNALATGLNDSADVVGSAFTSGGSQHAFLYRNGSMAPISALWAARRAPPTPSMRPARSQAGPTPLSLRASTPSPGTAVRWRRSPLSAAPSTTPTR